MNFGDMQDRVAQYLDRSDLTTHIRNWVNDTRVDVALKANLRYLYVEASAATVDGTKAYALPSDYLGHLVIWCGTKKLAKVNAREADELTDTDHEATANPLALTTEGASTITKDATSGPPDYYIERGMEFDLYPTPDATYTLKIKYYAQPSAWTASQSASYDYLSTFHYEALIWGACHRGAMFMDDAEGAAKYQGLYDKSIQEILKREKDVEVADIKVRMKSWQDYDLTTFKRLMKC